jgi:hypothetical protein
MESQKLRMRLSHLRLFALVATVVLPACGDDPVGEEEEPEVETVLVQNLPADPTDLVDGDGRPLGATGRFTFFSLRENKVIPNADSASTKWDVAFRTTIILTNGGVSGPGSGAAQVADGIFEDILEAPAEGWQIDTAARKAIPTGSGNGWYNYNPTGFTVTPIPGRVLLIRTADGKYAKIRILNYYRDAPATIDPFSDKERYYTFEYVYQPNGSRSFE